MKVLRYAEWIVWGLPALTLISVLSLFGLWGAGCGLALAWVGFCIGKGLLILREQEFAVIERIGEYRTVLFRGWHVLVIGVDTIREREDLRAEEYELYSDERATAMDFKGGVSAAVVVKVWYRIGKTEDAVVGRENWPALTEAVKLWTYAYKDAEKRVFALVDGALRPRLQAKTIDEASVDKDGVTDETIRAVSPSLEAIGVYAPNDKRLIVLEDIELPSSVVEMRDLVFQGQKEAQQNEARAIGYWKPIKDIAEKLDVNLEQARAIYETQRGLDTLKEVKPSMTLVGKDLAGVLGTINLGGSTTGGNKS